MKVALGIVLGALALTNAGCSLFAAGQVQAPVLKALADDDPNAASAALDDALGVGPGQIPAKQHAFTGLMLAERGTVHLAGGLHHQSTDDLRAADKLLDIEDMSLDDIMRHTAMPHGMRHGFHMGWFGAMNYPYVPRLHERLMVNPLAMIGYLDLGDDAGARVEARRLDVMIAFANRTAPGSPCFQTRALSGILAGFAFEQAGELESACREYRDAFEAASTDVSPLVPGGKEPTACHSPAFVGDGKGHKTAAAPAPRGEIFIVIGYGIVPHAEIASTDPPPGKFDLTGGNDAAEEASISVDGEAHQGIEVLQLADVVRADWDQATHEMGGSTTPLSWSTLPARFVVARVSVTPGAHHVEISVRGVTQKKDLLVPERGYAATSMFMLR